MLPGVLNIEISQKPYTNIKGAPSAISGLEPSTAPPKRHNDESFVYVDRSVARAVWVGGGAHAPRLNADGAPVTSSRTIAGGGGCGLLSRPRATTARFPPGASGVSPHALALTP